MQSVPTPTSQWRHKSTGNRYQILMIANSHVTRADYPVTVIYQGSDSKIWSRPLSRWYASMSPENEQFDCLVEPKPSISLPFTVWKHEPSGRLYQVLTITNEFATREDYPVTVVYMGSDLKVWSRPLSKWYDSMTPAA